MSKYPSDEFDRVPEYTDRQGVHRLDAGMAPVKRGGLWPLMLFGVAALIIGVVAFTLLRPQFGAEPTAGADASASQTADTAAESSAGGDDGGATASGDATEGDGQNDGAPDDGGQNEDGGASESAEESEQAGESGAVDQTLAVGVYNGSNQPGLAGVNADTLRSAGYTDVVTGNWTRQVEPTVVYYRSEESAATARAVADELGIATIYQTENVPVEISVVIGTVN
ncbi:LytR C-terminal domain-containing protein [Zhihengliuella sp.]|uniref:LytR C-terminal domain-containing protein n=1 Tax=Zhihengliuella sp. TaxID=1954483 RepID=UPI002812584D|nr:LytR C-terminal domain-containing protein [Zhihengliuella sp.]